MKKIIIIGAGPAGITAGYELLKQSKEYEVVILEETSELGGISRTVRHHGNRMDLGGHRFFSKDDRVMDWWEQIMPKQGSPSYDDKKLKRPVRLSKNGPDPEQEDRVLLSRNRVSRIYYKRKFFDYPISMSFSTIKSMGVLTTLQAGFSYLYSLIVKLPESSLENFYRNRFGKKLYSMFFEGYTEKLWGRHPREISADWGAQRVKGLSILAIIKDTISKIIPNKRDEKKVETSLIEEFWYPKYGPGQLWEAAGADFEAMGGRIKKGCKVTGVRTEGGRVKSVIYEEHGIPVVEEADYVISSMPLKDLVAGMNQVPKAVAEIAGGLPYRDFVTIGLLVKELSLENKTKLKTLNNIVPDCWIYVQDPGIRLGRIQIFNNWSPYLVSKPEETVWIGLEYFCMEGDSFWNASEHKCVKFAIKELVRMGVISSEEQVIDAHREHVKKAYPAYFDTYEHIQTVIDYLDTFENLYCVGRNGQHRYNNMDHSMVTSMEAVKNILNGTRDKTNVWNVNTEKEYHESK
ncbi:MAG: NAD(P)/FAD-dependent oxidoreductase [Lachnospiraceae bacterium]|nr:NAD(P)/FAD-dependent oxidoreductase [Lachnospiraceae bacterium]